MSLAAGPLGWGESSRLMGQQRRGMPSAVAATARIGVVVAVAVTGVWAARFITPSRPPQAAAPEKTAEAQTPPSKPKVAEQSRLSLSAPPTPAAAIPAAAPAPRAEPPVPPPTPRDTQALPVVPTPPALAPPSRALAFAPVAALTATPQTPAASASAPESTADDAPPQTKMSALAPASTDRASPDAAPRRSLRRHEPRVAGAAPACNLSVPKGYRVGWRIRGGKRTSCYVERIR